MEIEIGLPTDVKHVAHIGLDSCMSSIFSKGWNNLAEQELINLHSFPLSELELAIKGAQVETPNIRKSLLETKCHFNNYNNVIFDFFFFYYFCIQITVWFWKEKIHTAARSLILNSKILKLWAKGGTGLNKAQTIIEVPRQPDSKQCGFFVMRYMKEIIEGIIISGSSFLAQFKKGSYLIEEIDEVRAEWANCILDYI